MSILKRLNDGRIFSVFPTNGVFMFEEECDRNFVVELTRDEVKELARELFALAEAVESDS